MKISTNILVILSTTLGLSVAGCSDTEADLCDEFVVMGQNLDDEEPSAAALALDDALALAEETSDHLELQLRRTAEPWRCVDEATIDAVGWGETESVIVHVGDAEYALDAYLTSTQEQPWATLVRTRPVEADGEPLDVEWSDWSLLHAGPCAMPPDLAAEVPDAEPTESPAS